MFILISLRTEIARSVTGPIQGPRAEDAMAEPYLVQKIFGDLITADHKGPKRQLRVSKQSSIRSRGTRSSYSMDPGVSAQNLNFTRNPEKLAKVPGTREETNSHLHWQLLRIRKSLWRSLLESLHVYTTPIGDQRYCQKSSAQSKGRHLCCIAAIRSKWKLVGRFHGM